MRNEVAMSAHSLNRGIPEGIHDKDAALSRVAERIKTLTDVAHTLLAKQEALANRIYGEELRKMSGTDEKKLKEVRPGMLGIIDDNLENLQALLLALTSNSARLEETA